MTKNLTILYIIVILGLLASGSKGAQIGKSNSFSKSATIEEEANVEEQFRSNERADSIENEDDIENPRVKRGFGSIVGTAIDSVRTLGESAPTQARSLVGSPSQVFSGCLETGLDVAANEGRKWTPGPDFNPDGVSDYEKEKCGMIILQGLGIKFPPSEVEEALTPHLLGLRKNCEILAPTAPSNPTDKVPFATFMSRFEGIANLNQFRSWFNFKKMPAELVQSYDPLDESKEDLEESLSLVESYIEELIRRGVPPRNIVLMGFSQGGAMTIYTALRTRYEIGGFIPVITWMPRRLVEPVTELDTPVNRNTPILQINGDADSMVQYYPAGEETARDMQKVFTNYHMEVMENGNHATTPGSCHFLNQVRSWLRENTDITS